MTTLNLSAVAGQPPGSPEMLGPGARRTLAGGMLGAHLLLGWALLQVPVVREAAADLAPTIMVDLLAPAPQAPRPQPAVPPAPVVKRAPVLAPPPPVLAATPTRLLAEPVPTAPVPQPQMPPTPQPPAPAPAPAAPAAAAVPTVAAAPIAAPAPPAPVPAPLPAAPRQVVLTDTDWVRVPQLDYPPASRRLREAGTVIVRALIDVRGVPREVQLQRSSGFERLDREALAKARTARVRPRTDNGVPFEFWIAMPLAFELDP